MEDNYFQIKPAGPPEQKDDGPSIPVYDEMTSVSFFENIIDFLKEHKMQILIGIVVIYVVITGVSTIAKQQENVNSLTDFVNSQEEGRETRTNLRN